MTPWPLLLNTPLLLRCEIGQPIRGKPLRKQKIVGKKLNFTKTIQYSPSTPVTTIRLLDASGGSEELWPWLRDLALCLCNPLKAA